MSAMLRWAGIGVLLSWLLGGSLEQRAEAVMFGFFLAFGFAAARAFLRSGESGDGAPPESLPPPSESLPPLPPESPRPRGRKVVRFRPK